MKPNKHLYILLQEYDNAAIVTKDGKMVRGYVHRKEDLYDYADAIQEKMSCALRNTEAQQGIWLWKITNGWQEIAGWEIQKAEVP